jgi:hypothetical protein
VVQLAQGLPFAQETGHRVGVGGDHVRPEDLDGHDLSGTGIQSPVDVAHTSLAELVSLQVSDLESVADPLRSGVVWACIHSRLPPSITSLRSFPGSGPARPGSAVSAR